VLQRRDPETRDHSRRVAAYARALGLRLGLGADDLAALVEGATLHDIGKIGVPTSVLGKAGCLDDEEWQLMRRHPELGARIVTRDPRLRSCRRIIAEHHERWDGSGYPHGLRGTDIHLGARILAVVDAFDAMTQDRCYRRAMSVDAAVDELIRNRGTQFDPSVVDAFLSMVWGRVVSLAGRRLPWRALAEAA